MDDPTPKSRRWFRFSLRTMFVVVTVLAVFISFVVYNLNWIKERDEARLWLPKNGGSFSSQMTPAKSFPAPWSLRILSEHGERIVVLDRRVIKDELPAEALRMQRLFPEAKIKLFTFRGLKDYAFPDQKLDPWPSATQSSADAH